MIFPADLGSTRVSRVGERVLAIANFSCRSSPVPSSESQRKACFDGTSKPTRETRALPKPLNGETFAARAMSDGIRIGDFEAAFLQIFAEIEHGAAHE